LSVRVCLQSTTEEFLSLFKHLTDLEELERAFLRAVRGLGFHSGAYYRLYGCGRLFPAEFLFGERSSQWLEIYAERGYARCDPRIGQAFRSTSAFTWDEALATGPTAGACEVLEEERRLMALDGLVTPVRSGVDELGVCVLYSQARLSLSAYERLLLQGLCDAFSRRGLRLLEGDAGSRQPSLTNRERECLQLVAVGHSDQEIAAVFGRSFNTVHSHVESLRTKLRARSRAHLVLKATMAGLIPVGGLPLSAPAA
jgi:DNA-binding CsgD family transcriptional regulator